MHRAADSAIHHPPALHHLRRFVRTEHLPLHLQDVTTELEAARTKKSISVEHGFCLKSWIAEQHCSCKSEQPTLHFLICATSNLSFESVMGILESLQSRCACNLLYPLRILRVPSFPPTSEQQARQWSHNYWPTIYRRNNPFGPHLNIISQAEKEILDRAGEWMHLARSVGDSVSHSLLGEPIGAVIIERNADKTPLLIAAAGDARWGNAGNPRSGCGNVTAHAVMRAIGLVARKRRDLLKEPSNETSFDVSDAFADEPLTAVEADNYFPGRLAPGGYLCVGLEIYITHEPCVMCSMAILHSRFSRVVFGKQLPRTGGIAAEVPGKELADTEQEESCLRYGLFWRPELNWKLPAWQWSDDQACSQRDLSSANTQA